jgi:hypothetical protein
MGFQRECSQYNENETIHACCRVKFDSNFVRGNICVAWSENAENLRLQLSRKVRIPHVRPQKLHCSQPYRSSLAICILSLRAQRLLLILAKSQLSTRG